MSEPWQDILALAGFPPTAIVLDFETAFDADYSMSKMSTVEYVCDPRFEIVGLGYEDIGREVRNFLVPEEVASFIESVPWDQYTVVVQNGKFDCLVLRERFGVTPKYVVDILDLARHLDARDKHDLAHLAKKYWAPRPKGDTSQFKGLRWATMSDAQRVAMIEYCRDGDVPIETYLFKTLLPRITRPEVELRLANQTLRQYLVPQIKIDADLGRRLIVDMTAELQKPVDEINALGVRVVTLPRKRRKGWEPPTVRRVQVEDVSKDTTFLSMLKSALPAGESIPMKQGKNKLIPALAKTDTELDFLLSHPEPRVRALMAARKATDSWPTHISRVKKLMAQAAARGGYMSAPLVYYGAHTGRWSGSGGVNFQNFGARDVHELVKQVGQMLSASSGYIFGTGDLSQIEARTMAWIAGQEDLLEAFRQGRDIYSEFGTQQLYHKEVRKPRKDDPPELATTLKNRRDVCKESVLGAIFKMSGKTLYKRCCLKPSLKKACETGELTLPLCMRAIGLLRATYSKVRGWWDEAEQAWRFVARYPDQRATVSHCGRTLNFWNDHGTVVVQLPSGRCLFYPHAHASAASNECSYRWGIVHGGILAENIASGIARDVFAEGLLRMEDAGFEVLFSVHDQAVNLLAAGDEARLAEMHRLQCVLPTWAEGLPVATEGDLSDRYHK